NSNYIFSSLGVGGFSIYTSFAIVFPSMWYSTINYGRKQKILARFFLLFASISVFLSAFTFASIIMIISFIIIVLKEYFVGTINKKIIYTIFISFLLITIAPFLYAKFISNFDDNIFRFMWNKFENIFLSTTSSGSIIIGDETNRFYWLITELSRFLDSPILGYYSFTSDANLPIFFHSSFSNFLVIFGVPFAFLWFLILYKLFKANYDQSNNSYHKFGIKITVLFFIFGGLLNPIWNNPVVFASVISFLVFPKRVK
ncbi:MAG: hypothetical protein GY932_13490, partial [Arcobacter sp.]|nr:hypothetical protein [Arcobacter sp.]